MKFRSFSIVLATTLAVGSFVPAFDVLAYGHIGGAQGTVSGSVTARVIPAPFLIQTNNGSPEKPTTHASLPATVEPVELDATAHALGQAQQLKLIVAGPPNRAFGLNLQGSSLSGGSTAVAVALAEAGRTANVLDDHGLQMVRLAVTLLDSMNQPGDSLVKITMEHN